MYRCFLVIAGALALAELGSMITLSGGEWIYMNSAFSPLHHIWGDVPAFLFSWTSVVALKTSSVAIVCLTFSEYIMSPFFDECGPPVLILKLLTAVTISKQCNINVFYWTRSLVECLAISDSCWNCSLFCPYQFLTIQLLCVNVFSQTFISFFKECIISLSLSIVSQLLVHLQKYCNHSTLTVI